MAEHDLTQAEDREHRRWMTRMNKNTSSRVKKDEMGRLQASGVGAAILCLDLRLELASRSFCSVVV
eukprot:6187128-Pleurochrysis_carterae.AAC.1